MAARPTWKGLLQISRVTIPIKVYPATESSANLSFHQLHESCQSRMQQKRWCPICVREVPASEIVKGYEFAKGRYVVLLEAELEAVKPDSTRVIDLVQFSAWGAMEWRALDRAYVLVPDGPDGGPASEAYLVMQEAMIGQVGIGKLAMYGREFLVAVSPRERVLMLYTLHHAAELREAPAVAEGASEVAALKLARHLLAGLTRPLDLSAFTDDYQADVRRLIDAKIAGQEIVEPAVAESLPVLALKDALEQSLKALRVTKPIPAKASLKKKTA